MAEVRIYTTDPCGFCGRAKALLRRKGVAFEEIFLDKRDMDARRALVRLTGRYTIPQVLIDQRPVGGYDELRALDAAGRLDELLGLAA